MRYSVCTAKALVLFTFGQKKEKKKMWIKTNAALGTETLIVLLCLRFARRVLLHAKS